MTRHRPIQGARFGSRSLRNPPGSVRAARIPRRIDRQSTDGFDRVSIVGPGPRVHLRARRFFSDDSILLEPLIAVDDLQTGSRKVWTAARTPHCSGKLYKKQSWTPAAFLDACAWNTTWTFSMPTGG